MFKLNSLLFLVALGLASASAQLTKTSPSTTITALPYSITAPGTYVLQSDLIDSVPGTAIVISATALSGPLTVDFKGHTITGSGLNSTAVAFDYTYFSNLYPITVRNGTLSNFQNGIKAVGFGIPRNYITISSIVFNLATSSSPGNDAVGVSFQGASNCNVSNCTFNAVITDLHSFGISDGDPWGGNTYNSNAFSGIAVPLAIGTNFDEGIASLNINCQTSVPKK